MGIMFFDVHKYDITNIIHFLMIMFYPSHASFYARTKTQDFIKFCFLMLHPYCFQEIYQSLGNSIYLSKVIYVACIFVKNNLVCMLPFK